jgi:hypothetical protein
METSISSFLPASVLSSLILASWVSSHFFFLYYPCLYLLFKFLFGQQLLILPGTRSKSDYSVFTIDVKSLVLHAEAVIQPLSLRLYTCNFWKVQPDESIEFVGLMTCSW